MTDAIATNKTVYCTEHNDTKEMEPQMKTQNDSNTKISCDVINTTSLGEIIADNTTSKVNLNDTLQSNNDSIRTDKCLNNVNISAETCNEEQTKAEVNKNGDTVTKYVYKKSDKTVTQNKSKGHIKNSILRRKRSLEVEPAYDIKSLQPASVDYTTSHDKKDREELVSPQYKPGGIIKKDNLANFNIETLHEDSNLPANNGREGNYDKPKSKKIFNYDNTSNRPQKYDNIEELDKNIRESTESNSNESGESHENIESKNHHSPYTKQKEIIYKSNENSDELPYSQKNTQNDRIKTDSKYIPNDDSQRVNYKSHSDSLYARNPSITDDVENSSESNKYGKPKSDKNNASYEDKPINANTPRSLQDVDLGDFSYERIQVNDKGQVEPTKDVHENYNSDLTPNTAPEPKSYKTKSESLTADVESSTGDDVSVSNEQPININDGEVKPVVELNNEDDSRGSSEESSSEPQNSHLEKAEDGIKSSEEEQSSSKELNEKIVALKENDGDKVNVKQQFERIPLDYNHDNKSQVQKEDENTDKSETAKLNKDDKTNDGTLDSLIPKEETDDDTLNIKFDEIPIKLPEINFPDDILSYAGIIAPKKGKNKNKSKDVYHYHNDDDDSEENQDEVKKGVNNDHDNYGIYNSYIDKDHANYRISNSGEDGDDDGVVDLYEKFVKERFGKKGSFGKRSEKLQVERKPKNPKLLKTIQTLLKQTEKVRDDAEKSGDPNAGYMWTLEYGENH
ncbi:uncharacterized protein [Epargyreus clarus]|uniref:uncharacterized protein n=1 Tax=Epargyreus clarus TaxID=520877 RepID=UPI003C2F2702